MLAVVGFLLVLPFFAIATVQLNSASDNLEAAEQVQVSASRLELLVRLRPAINNETLAVSLQSERVADLSSMATASSLTNLGEQHSIEETQLAVDEIVSDIDHPPLTQALMDARATTQSETQGSTGTSAAYLPARHEAQNQIERELLAVSSAAGATENDAIGDAARLATRVADLQQSTLELDRTWALLEASMLVTPTTEDVPRLTRGIANFEEQAALLDSQIPAEGPIRDLWNEISASEELSRLFERYHATTDRFVREGLDANIRAEGEALSGADLASTLELASTVEAGFAESTIVNENLAALADVALEELSISAQVSLDDAAQRRQFTIVSLVATAMLFALATFFSVRFISRPMQRLSDVAHRIGLGDLEAAVPEVGPREVRVGARAMNEALGSLRHVEAQAIALAEQRLDDPVLEDAAPGALGRSLQGAVSRLTDSVTERDEIRTKLEYEAGHDSLTHLANRRSLFDHLGDQKHGSDEFALLFLDLDQFKYINDTHGHGVGDEVLCTIANRISEVVDEGSLAARLGGDEFVVVTQPLDSSSQALDIAQRLHKALTQPITVAKLSIVPEISIGLTMADRSKRPTEMLRDADLALYQSKQDTSHPIVLIDDQLRAAVEHENRLEEALRDALAGSEFELHFQPLVSAADGSVAHLETLIRWQSSDGHYISPADFIPVAERSNLIIDLDRFVLGRVAELIADGSFSHVDCVSVNISGRHLGSGQLADHVSEILSATKIDPAHLLIEITETSLLDDFETAARDLATLRTLGVAVALDDFGTGFMSLAYLRTLPVDILKIDKSFIDEIETTEGASMVKLVVDTGHLLDLVVVAEGVETEQQAELLTEMGIDLLQGYWFGRPGPLTAPSTDELFAA